jgi:uncharacterized protein involved in response to NO
MSMVRKTTIFLNYAFRPFFLLNGLFAVVVMIFWVMALHGVGSAGLPADILMWHGHEMLVGFAMAAIAGFVLTAVATWTDRPPLNGVPLGLLVVAWLIGRGAMLFGGLLPAWLVGLIDLVFPILLVLYVGREIIGGSSRRNYPIIGITVLLALLDLVYHLGAAQVIPGADRLAVYLLIHLALLLITVIAGRIVPNFSANWLRARGQTHLPTNNTLIDGTTILITLVTGVAASIVPASVITGLLAFAAALMHALRLSRWRGLATRKEPLLFVLHVAYLWLPVGYALTACSVFGWLFPPTAALHALTMGGVGGMILAVTTRVALAHTGRPLHAARLTVIAYCIFTIAVFIRVLGPVMESSSLALIDLSALGWIATFAIFSWVYWPVLTGPRVDSKQGL